MTTPASEQFIATLTAPAKASAEKTGIPWQFTVAEAGLESGWGLHAPGFNLFGIKAQEGDGWTGDRIAESSREVIGGQSKMIVSFFRAYSSWEASLDDHAKFLTENERYKPAFATKTPQDFARAVAAAKYATDPNYAQKIIEIMEDHKLC